MNHTEIERRAVARIKLPPEQYFLYCHAAGKTAMITDFNSHGLQSKYISTAAVKPDLMPGLILIDIHPGPFRERGIYGIRCRKIYDLANLEEDGTYSGSSSRICGMKFEILTTQQRSKLEQLMSSMIHHT